MNIPVKRKTKFSLKKKLVLLIVFIIVAIIILSGLFCYKGFNDICRTMYTVFPPWR